jgi:hypothetical protein
MVKGWILDDALYRSFCNVQPKKDERRHLEKQGVREGIGMK